MRLYLSLCAALFATVVCEVEVNDDGVMVLKTDTFKEGLASADYVLVEFYAPWCGHCKALAPEYAKAATSLREESPELSVKLGMVDATVESDLGKEYGVRGYPTLKFFHKGQAMEYGGGRKADEIVNWIKKKTGPPAVDLKTADDVSSLKEAEKIVLVAFFSDSESDIAKAYIEAAKNTDDIKFGLALDAEVAKAADVEDGKIVLFRKFDEPKLVYDGEATAAGIEAFFKANQLPIIVEFSDETAGQIFGGSIKLHSLLFLKRAEESADALLEQYKAAALQLKGQAIFVFFDIEKESNKRVMEFFNLDGSSGTEYRVVKMEAEMEKFKPDFTEFTTSNFVEYVTSVKAGTVKKHLMTEDIPEDWDKEAVKVLVGKNFEEVAFDKSKDVLVEFYAPWCGHCKALAPIYDELGEAFKDNADIVIAKVDSTKNEVSAVQVQGFPTLVLIRSGDNKVITYNGGRTFAELKAFVESKGEKEAEDDEAEEEEKDDHDEL